MLETITRDKESLGTTLATPDIVTAPTNSTLRKTLQTAGLAGRYAGYTAHFRVEEVRPGCWWLLDGEVKVGMIYGEWHAAELINTDPFEPNHDVTFPDMYHAPTQMGERITLAKWIDYGRAAGSDRNEISFECNGASVTAIVREEWDNGRTAWTRATWKVDADFGYVLHVENELHSPEPENPDACQEYSNFLPRGVTDDRPGHGARFPHVLWQHPGGEVIRWNQNNVSARALGGVDLKDQRRIATGGFIGFFGETDKGVALEILESSPEAAAITCPNMLDQHIVWNAFNGEEVPRGADGEWVYRSAFNVVVLPPQVGDSLTALARPLDLIVNRVDEELEATVEGKRRDYPRLPGQPHVMRFYPIEMNVVCDFETLLDPNSSFRGQAFPYLEDVDERITTVSDCGNSGTHSLRLRAMGDKVRAKSIGCSWHLSPGQGYRLSAWVKTDLTAGAARLRAEEYRFNPDNILGVHDTALVTGQADWQFVAVEWVPGEDAHVVDVWIELDGQGTAWVDDILIEEI